ncbi:MAG: hypothetical protein IKM64_03600, partial [Clostridia bacterium]|nr:hypothetical protein [Clostridia bacterium]
DELQNARYGYAISLIDQAQYTDAIQRLEEMDGYMNSDEYILKAQYMMALDQKARGELALAQSSFELLGDYADSKDQAKDCIYQQALNLAEAGKTKEATDLFLTVSDYLDARDRISDYAYQAAQVAENDGDLAEAARLYAQAGDVKDAKEKAETCADLYYAEAYRMAKAATEAKDYQSVVNILAPFWQDQLSEKYAEIPGLYREACYQYANQLYSDEKKPFEALKYYRQIMDYADVAEKKMDRTVYRLMGTWETDKGYTFIFREDGTCSIDGRESYYNASLYGLSIGDREDELTYTYNVMRLTEKNATLLHEKKNVYYRLTRVTEE